MRVVKCDRCGKIVEDEKYYKFHELPAEKGKIECRINGYDPGFALRSVNLCFNCIIELNDFIYSNKINNTEIYL